MITAGAYKCLLRDIGYNITSSELANSCPKPSLIAKLEVDLAADVLAKVLHEIKCGGVKEVAIITDHGHRGGQDHFVIVLVWYGKDKNGNDVVQFFCQSIDYAGHTAKEGLSRCASTRSFS